MLDEAWIGVEGRDEKAKRLKIRKRKFKSWVRFYLIQSMHSSGLTRKTIMGYYHRQNRFYSFLPFPYQCLQGLLNNQHKLFLAKQHQNPSPSCPTASNYLIISSSLSLKRILVRVITYGTPIQNGLFEIVSNVCVSFLCAD